METGVQCAAQNEIKAIVATGIAGTSKYTIGRGVEVPKYFWKLVCYRDKKSSETHVALFVGDNEPIAKETYKMKEYTVTPRSQKDLNSYDSSILSANNPWDGAEKMNENFALINRYPKPSECKAAMDLPDEQVARWKKQFEKYLSDQGGQKRRKRAIDAEPFCSQAQFDDIFAMVDSDIEDGIVI